MEKDYSSYVGCVGFFWNDDKEDMVLDVLDKVISPYFYTSFLGRDYKNFRPCHKEDLNFRRNRVIIRIYEDGKPIIIFLDEPASFGKVLYHSSSGKNEGVYDELIKKSLRADRDERELALKTYGYDNVKSLEVITFKKGK